METLKEILEGIALTAMRQQSPVFMKVHLSTCGDPKWTQTGHSKTSDDDCSLLSFEANKCPQRESAVAVHDSDKEQDGSRFSVGWKMALHSWQTEGWPAKEALKMLLKPERKTVSDTVPQLCGDNRPFIINISQLSNPWDTYQVMMMELIQGQPQKSNDW